jgi:hypothetical protein
MLVLLENSLLHTRQNDRDHKLQIGLRQSVTTQQKKLILTNN